MYFGNVDFLGSMVDHLPEPETTFQEHGFLVQEWQFLTGASDAFVFRYKTKMTYNDHLEEWFNIFSDLFTEEIISDARRILFDVETKNKYPSNMVLSAIILACELHNINFKEKFKDVCDIVSRNRKINKRITLGKFLYRNLHQEANKIKKQLGKKKFENMEKVWEHLNGK